MAFIIYTPTTHVVPAKDDELVYYSVTDLAKRHGRAIKVINNGKAKLERLDEPGSILYVVGHGNAGGKIGAHGHENVGARTLVRQLIAEGLPVAPQNRITLHLYACATGTSVRTVYHLWRKDPNAQRFAQALAEAGGDNFTVIGYVGFMNSSGMFSVDYHMQDNSKRNFKGRGHGSGDAETITFDVSGGTYRKTAGDDWQQFIEKRMHIQRRNSTVLTIRKAA